MSFLLSKIMEARKFILLSNVIGYHIHDLPKSWEDFWEDPLIPASEKPPSTDTLTEMALKIGAKMPLNEAEKVILNDLADKFKDNYCDNYDEHDQEELSIIFAGFEPPDRAEIDQLVLELTLPRLKARGILISFPCGSCQTTYDAGLRQHRRGRTVHER
jgi:hypothetical protein